MRYQLFLILSLEKNPIAATGKCAVLTLTALWIDDVTVYVCLFVTENRIEVDCEQNILEGSCYFLCFCLCFVASMLSYCNHVIP